MDTLTSYKCHTVWLLIPVHGALSSDKQTKQKNQHAVPIYYINTCMLKFLKEFCTEYVTYNSMLYIGGDDTTILPQYIRKP